MSRSLITTCFLVLLASFSASAQTAKITAAEAKDHVGEIQTVCGKVASAHYATETKYKDAMVCVTGKITSYQGSPR
jgi:hypothetical protein